MTAPWNIRITPMRLSWNARNRMSPPDAYKAEVRIKNEWYQAGISDSWWGAVRMGIVS